MSGFDDGLDDRWLDDSCEADGEHRARAGNIGESPDTIRGGIRDVEYPT